MALPLTRRGSISVLAVLLVAFMTFAGSAEEKSNKKQFAGPKNTEERRGLLEQWRAERIAGSSSAKGRVRTHAVGGTSIVGRASMEINNNGDVAYTKNWIGEENNCEVYLDRPNSRISSQAYSVGDHMRDGSGFRFMASVAGTTAGAPPVFDTAAVGNTTVDGTVTWKFVGTTRSASTTYATGMVVRGQSNGGFNYRASPGGTTPGGGDPVWPLTPGGTVVDGSVTWQAIGYYPGSFVGCNPMTLAIRLDAGGETVIAEEGDAIGASELSGWGEFIAMNNSGKVAFKANLAGFATDEDEGGTAVLTAGPGAGALTKIADSTETIGGRPLGGIGPLVAINDSGQILFDGYENDGPASGNERKHGLIRFTSPATKQLLVAVGSTFDGGTVAGFGLDNVAASIITYDDGNPYLTPGGHTPVVLRFNDSTQGAYILTGPLAGTTVTKTGAGPYAVIQPRMAINDSDQVLFKAGPGTGRLWQPSHAYNLGEIVYSSRYPGEPRGALRHVVTIAGTSGASEPTFAITAGGVQGDNTMVWTAELAPYSIIRFTAPSDFDTVATVGDDVGTRMGGAASGVTFTSLGNYFDINNSGNAVFRATTSNDQEGYYFWNGANGLIQPIFVKLDQQTLAPEMITLNDANMAAFVTGNFDWSNSEDSSEDTQDSDDEDATVYLWNAQNGGLQHVLAIGDMVGGDEVTGIYGQHPSWRKRQMNESSCVAFAYAVNDDDIYMDNEEGDQIKSPLMFVSCANVTACPEIFISPPTLPGGTNGTAYNLQLTASGGSGPYTFGYTGTLPTGMTLDANGLLSGTPTQSGDFPISVTATDDNGCVGTANYTLTIGAGGQVNLTISPNTLQVIAPGETVTFTVTISQSQGTNTTITLDSSDPSIASVPPSVVILANQTTAQFDALGVSPGGPVVISASLPGSFNAPPATAYVQVVSDAVPIPTFNFLGLMLLGLALLGVGWLVKR